LNAEAGDVRAPICNQLAELMNGRLGFESSAGADSTFFLELPS
jgi:signal transduction histidine kinase